MSILHLVNKSPFTNTSIFSCLDICSPTDAILFMEDGVLGCLPTSPANDKLRQITANGVEVFGLIADIKARGLLNKTSPFITLVDYDGFVQLSIKHHCIQSWY